METYRRLFLTTLLIISNTAFSKPTQINLFYSSNKNTIPYSLDQGRSGIIPDIVKEIFSGNHYVINTSELPTARIKKLHISLKRKIGSLTEQSHGGKTERILPSQKTIFKKQNTLSLKRKPQK